MSNEKLDQFKSFTGANSTQAKDYLSRAGGSVEVAVNLWFESGEEPLPEEAPKAVSKGSTGGKQTQASFGLLEFVVEGGDHSYVTNEPLKLQNWTGDYQVKIDDKGNSVSVQGYYNWGSARAPVKAHKGRWYYEVTIQTNGQMRIGWAAENYRPAGQNDGEAVGSSPDSWGWDGSNKQIFHDPKNKNDKGINGVAYGDYWASGDVIGCMLDFDLREIKYSRNGHQLGVAFQDVSTFNPLIPCLSVKRGVKCSVNLGPTFSYPVPSYYGLDPVASQSTRKALTKIFESYAKKGLSLSDSQSLDVMSGNGVAALVADLGGVNMTDPHFLLLNWRLRPKDFLSIQLSEWLLLWSNEKVSTLSEMKNCVTRWNKEIKDENVFTSFYSFVFDYMRLEKGERNTVLDKNDAKGCWEVLGIKCRFKFYDDWIQFWEEGTLKGINKDTWMMLLVFIRKLGNSPSNYDDNDCWPSVFDDFVHDVLLPKYGK